MGASLQHCQGFLEVSFYLPAQAATRYHTCSTSQQHCRLSPHPTTADGSCDSLRRDLAGRSESINVPHLLDVRSGQRSEESDGGPAYRFTSERAVAYGTCRASGGALCAYAIAQPHVGTTPQLPRLRCRLHRLGRSDEFHLVDQRCKIVQRPLRADGIVHTVSWATEVIPSQLPGTRGRQFQLWARCRGTQRRGMRRPCRAPVGETLIGGFAIPPLGEEN